MTYWVWNCWLILWNERTFFPHRWSPRIACNHHDKFFERPGLIYSKPLSVLLVLFPKLTLSLEPKLTIFFNMVNPFTPIAKIWEAFKLQESPIYLFTIIPKFATLREGFRDIHSHPNSKELPTHTI